MSVESNLDADAFMRKYLKQPTDTTARLVFADWLEETGEPHNAAWAHFIRLKAEADRYPANSATRHELDRHAGVYATQIRSRLTIPAKLFVGYPKSLLQLLPASNITVNLARYAVPQSVVELMPESVARENLALPLDAQGRMLLVATVNPHDLDLIQKLEFILNRDIILIGAEREDVQEALDRHYGQTETEVVECISYESPLIGLEGIPESFELYGVFHTAFSGSCTGFEMALTPLEARVTYFDANTPNKIESRITRGAFACLLNHLLEQPPEAEYTEGGRRCLDLLIPLLSGRPFPATLERQPHEKGSDWFRLRFRW